MNITLELWDDQSEIGDDIKTSMWVMKLNEKMFPSEKDSLMTLDVAHKIVNKLLEIEELAYNDNL
jgi:hypothetical protein